MPGGWWRIDFAAADNATLVPGVYSDVDAFPSANHRASMRFQNDSPPTPFTSAKFTVLSVDYGPSGEVLSFDAIYEVLLPGYSEPTGVRDDDKISLSDGCGLSRENLVTPRFQTSLLHFLSQRYYFDLFRNTLAVSGTDGTLRNRMSALDVRGSIHAKTGTLNGVTTLAGYMTTKSGRNLVFSIFANRVNAVARVKKTIDEICSLFVDFY